MAEVPGQRSRNVDRLPSLPCHSRPISGCSVASCPEPCARPRHRRLGDRLDPACRSAQNEPISRYALRKLPVLDRSHCQGFTDRSVGGIPGSGGPNDACVGETWRPSQRSSLVQNRQAGSSRSQSPCEVARRFWTGRYRANRLMGARVAGSEGKPILHSDSAVPGTSAMGVFQKCWFRPPKIDKHR